MLIAFHSIYCRWPFSSFLPSFHPFGLNPILVFTHTQAHTHTHTQTLGSPLSAWSRFACGASYTQTQRHICIHTRIKDNRRKRMQCNEKRSINSLCESPERLLSSSFFFALICEPEIESRMLSRAHIEQVKHDKQREKYARRNGLADTLTRTQSVRIKCMANDIPTHTEMRRINECEIARWPWPWNILRVAL